MAGIFTGVEKLLEQRRAKAAQLAMEEQAARAAKLAAEAKERAEEQEAARQAEALASRELAKRRLSLAFEGGDMAAGMAAIEAGPLAGADIDEAAVLPSGPNLLLDAIRKRKPMWAKMLLEAGATAQATEAAREIAAARLEDALSMELLPMLARAGADLFETARAASLGIEGTTAAFDALSFACFRTHRKMVKVLADLAVERAEAGDARAEESIHSAISVCEKHPGSYPTLQALTVEELAKALARIDQINAQASALAAGGAAEAGAKAPARSYEQARLSREVARAVEAVGKAFGSRAGSAEDVKAGRMIADECRSFGRPMAEALGKMELPLQFAKPEHAMFFKEGRQARVGNLALRAAMEERWGYVDALLAAEAPLDLDMLLLMACNSGRANTVAALIEAGADPSARSAGAGLASAVQMAVLSGAPKCAEVACRALGKGAAAGRFGAAALDEAMRAGRMIEKALAGVDPKKARAVARCADEAGAAFAMSSGAAALSALSESKARESKLREQLSDLEGTFAAFRKMVEERLGEIQGLAEEAGKRSQERPAQPVPGQGARPQKTQPAAAAKIAAARAAKAGQADEAAPGLWRPWG